MKFCTNCRKQINLDARFCQDCGTKQDEQNLNNPHPNPTETPLETDTIPTAQPNASVQESTSISENTSAQPNVTVQESASISENAFTQDYSNEEDDANKNIVIIPEILTEEIPTQTYSFNDEDEEPITIIEAETVSSTVIENKNILKKQIMVQGAIVGVIGVVVALVVISVLSFNDDFETEYKDGDVFVNLDVNDMPTLDLEEEVATEEVNESQTFGLVGSKLVEYMQNYSVVTLPDNITSIEANAFSNCTELTTIKIPSSVVYIDPAAFNGCVLLYDFEFIGEPADGIYDMLAKLEIYKDFIITDRTITSYRGLSNDIVIPNFITKIADGYFDFDVNVGVFSNRYSVKTVKIPDSVTYIGSNAFASCYTLTTITLPENLEYIGDNAFLACENLVEIVIPESVTHIGAGAFADCKLLKNVSVPATVKTIPTEAFRNCVELENIELKEVIEIEENAFLNCQKLEVVEIPTTVEKIGVGAFSNVPWFNGLTDEFNVVGDGVLIKYTGKGVDVSIPDTVRHIGNVFAGYEDLRTVLIPNSVVTINAKSFANRKNITKIEIPESVVEIGASAFENCTGLTSIVIPETVKSIGNNAFWGCESLSDVVIPETVSVIGQSAFDGTPWLTSLSDEYNIFGDNNLIKYNFASVNTEVPHGVVTIPDRLFFNTTQMRSMVLPLTVKSIGIESFFKCTSLAEIEIPDSVVEIGFNAFNGCTSLTKITIPKSVESIGEYAFVDCTALEVMYVREGSFAESWAFENLDPNVKIEHY